MFASFVECDRDKSLARRTHGTGFSGESELDMCYVVHIAQTRIMLVTTVTRRCPINGLNPVTPRIRPAIKEGFISFV
jgi:hypothetical protein